jgi:hypothetical protein
MSFFRILICLLIFLFSFFKGFCQKIEILHSGTGISLRGLSVVNDKIIWVSGTKGTVGKSTDGGKTWDWMTVNGYTSKDFRDIEAFDARTALVMAVGEPALIFKTINGGITWKIVYTNNTPGMFLDAMEFWNDESGIVIGDPVNGKFFVARTFDGGFNWRALSYDKSPAADSSEACFAASGTNVRALTRDQACFVTGGSKSRLFRREKSIPLEIIQGKETQGANSVAVWFKKIKKPRITIVGGDFASDTSRKLNCTFSNDGGETWFRPSNPPYGYRSCVEYISSNKIITCGITGVDISMDEGFNWNNISSTGFHVCRKAKKGKTVYLAGAGGRIGKLAL